MTVLIVFFHTEMTYGGEGSWYYREVPSSRAPFSIFATLSTLTAQASLMGFFFLLAGYFTPKSFDRKGPVRFLLDRFLRLGIPLAAFIFLLSPITIAMIAAARGDGFWPSIMLQWTTKDFYNGPMWFAEGLLILSVGYCLWRLIAARFLHSGPPSSQSNVATVPSSRIWFLAALGVGGGAVLLRCFAPVDTRYFGLWVGYFSSYIFLFAVGAAAWRRDWLARIPWKQARLWLIISCLVWPIMPLTYVALRLHGQRPYFAGGISGPTFLYAFWEPFVAWGIIAAWLVWFRDRFNRPSVVQSWLGRRAYTVYVIHPPVLVGVCLVFRHWHASAPLKCAVMGSLACTAAWLLADPLIRLPGLRRIL